MAGQHRNKWLIRFPEDLRPVVEKIARDEDRRREDVARTLIREGLRYRGLVPDPRSGSNNNNVNSET